MPKVWNLGNTTVRNPNRLREGLILLAREFQGNLHGADQETKFVKELKEAKIIESEGSNPDWFGRKWRSAFVKLGFITEKFNKKYDSLRDISKELGLQGKDYEITPAGKLLISADSIGAIDDIFTRQLVHHEIPSPLEGSFPIGKMKPFIFLLQILYELQNLKQPGLNKVEIAAFIQLFRNHTNQEVKNTIKRILEYRKSREGFSGKIEKNKCDLRILKETSNEVIKGSVKAESLIDYADTTVRYSKMTGLITHEGSRLLLRKTKLVIVEEILKNETKFRDSPEEYIKNFYFGGSIPTDNPGIAYKEILILTKKLKTSNNQIPNNLGSMNSSTDIRVLSQMRHKLIELFNESEEEVFALKQREDSSIEDILGYLDALESRNKSKFGIIDRPTYLEWSIWRAFLAIDHITIPINKTRRFPIDEDMLPRHPAPGGGPDMIFEFKDFKFAVEVTLTTSSRQEATEGISVRKHISDVAEIGNKIVYGIFIAPSIDNNTAEVFRVGSFYKDDREHFVDIVPFSTEQFKKIIETLLRKKYGPVDLKGLLDSCLLARNKTKAPEWKQIIEQETINWIKSLEAM